MTPEQKAAFINAQAVSALARIAGMQADNAYRIQANVAPYYNMDDFNKVPDEFGLGHNTLISFFAD